MTTKTKDAIKAIALAAVIVAFSIGLILVLINIKP